MKTFDELITIYLSLQLFIYKHFVVNLPGVSKNYFIWPKVVCEALRFASIFECAEIKNKKSGFVSHNTKRFVEREKKSGKEGGGSESVVVFSLRTERFE